MKKSDFTPSTVLLLQTQLKIAQDEFDNDELDRSIDYIEQVEHHLATIARELRDEIQRRAQQLTLIK